MSFDSSLKFFNSGKSGKVSVNDKSYLAKILPIPSQLSPSFISEI